MGGCGTFASGNSVGYNYQTVGTIAGIKVLQGTNGKHGLPEEPHSSNAYIKLKPDGTFYEMRICDGGSKSENVLHIHEYKRDNFRDRTPRLMTSEEIKQYKKYFIQGYIENDPSVSEIYV